MYKVNPGSTRFHVYQILRNQILNLQYIPGECLSEKEISEKFQVSRTPVREAFLQLSQEGLLEVFPQKGTFVSLIDLGLVEDARFMREQMEKAIVTLACEEFPEEKFNSLEINLQIQKFCEKQCDYQKLFDLDEEFHRTIFQGCYKERLWLAMQPMNTHFNRIRFMRLVLNNNWNHIISQHIEILNAIKEHKSEQAVKIMHEHLTVVVSDKEELKKENPRYFR